MLNRVLACIAVLATASAYQEPSHHPHHAPEPAPPIACAGKKPLPRGTYSFAATAALRRVKYVPPVYPTDARQHGVKGTVILGAVIDTDGVVRMTQIYRSIPLLDDAAVAAVCQWRFTAARVAQNPVAVEMTVTVEFPPPVTKPEQAR